MKINVTLTIDIKDPADWTLAFGVEGAANIRTDVREYVLNNVQQSGVFGNGEVDADVTLKP